MSERRARGRSFDTRRWGGLAFISALLVIMWISESIDALVGGSLDQHGILPRESSGLDGVVWAPFLHKDFEHLIANTLPFLVLGGLIALSGLARILAVSAIVAAVGGGGTWLLGPDNTVHIGASGLVFGYGGYLILRGIFDRSLRYLALGVVVAVLYGSALLSGLVPQDGVSWQGHLFGLIGGIVAAWLLRRKRAPERTSA